MRAQAAGRCGDEWATRGGGCDGWCWWWSAGERERTTSELSNLLSVAHGPSVTGLVFRFTARCHLPRTKRLQRNHSAACDCPFDCPRVYSAGACLCCACLRAFSWSRCSDSKPCSAPLDWLERRLPVQPRFPALHFSHACSRARTDGQNVVVVVETKLVCCISIVIPAFLAFFQDLRCSKKWSAHRLTMGASSEANPGPPPCEN